MTDNELVIRAQLGSEVVATAITLLMETQRLKDTLDFAMMNAPEPNDLTPTYQQLVCEIIDKATMAVTELREFMERQSDERWQLEG